MSDVKAIVAAARSLRQAGTPFLLATVVNVRGSSYRRPGARMIIADDRRVAGSVSGGCLEQELVRRGWWYTRSGAPALLTFDASDDREDSEPDGGPHARTGCGGVVEILLERVAPDPASDPLSLLDAAVTDEATIETLTVFRSNHADLPAGARRAVPPPGAALEAAAVSALAAATPWVALIERARWALARDSRSYAVVGLPDGSVEALAERLRPPPHLFVFGGGPDVVPVVGLARALGWTVTVWAPHARFEAKARFAVADHFCNDELNVIRARIDASARPLGVVMSHSMEHDRQALGMLLSSKAGYVGVLGPRRRTDRLLAALFGGGALSEEQRRRLHAPVGLQLGAETADEIALAIIAEAQASVTGAAAGHLSQQPQAIHACARVATAPARSSARVGGR